MKTSLDLPSGSQSSACPGVTVARSSRSRPRMVRTGSLVGLGDLPADPARIHPTVFNTAFTSDAVSPTVALSLLQGMTAMDGHEFWFDDVDCVSAAFSRDIRLTGHRQVTDAYLLSLARARSGCLATPDRRAGWLLPRHLRPDPRLRIVEARQIDTDSREPNRDEGE